MANAGAWDVILLGYNTDALVEFNVAGDFDLSTLFTVKHPTAAQLAKFARSRSPSNLFPLRHAFGISAYAISPAGARKLIQRCFPMDNRLIVFKASNHRFNAFSLDCMMNVFYKDLAAYAFRRPAGAPAQRLGSLDGRRAQALGRDRQHDLAEVVAALHAGMRLGGAGEGIGRVDHRHDLPRLE